MSKYPAGPRFYLDENLSHRLGPLCRARALDVTSAQELGRDRLSDAEQLRYAAAEGRILVTLDEWDLIQATLEAAAAGRPHFGVLIVKWKVDRPAFGVFATALQRFAAARPEGMVAYEVNWLPRPLGG